MPMTIDQLANEALALPSESRALLAEQLVQSLENTAGHLDALWAAEVLRRLDEVRAGRVQTISGNEAAASVRRAVGRQNDYHHANRSL